MCVVMGQSKFSSVNVHKQLLRIIALDERKKISNGKARCFTSRLLFGNQDVMKTTSMADQ